MSLPGRFVHLELLTPSLEKTIPFLAELLELEVLFVNGEAPFYGLATPGNDVPFFGVMAIEPDPAVRSHWIGYVATDDLAEAGAQATELGAAIHYSPPDSDERPDDVDTAPPAMWFIGDTQGAVFAMVPSDAAQPGVIGPGVDVGGASWFELLTTDIDAAADFYAGVLGWDIGPAVDRGDEGLARPISSGGVPFGLIRVLQPGSSMPPHWLHCLRVNDLDAAVAKVRGLGGFHFEDPAAIPGGRRAIVLEPTGAPIGLWQPDAG